MVTRPALVSIGILVGSLVGGVDARAESLQEKIIGLYEATAEVEVALTPLGCTVLQFMLARFRILSEPFLAMDYDTLTAELMDLGECGMGAETDLRGHVWWEGEREGQAPRTCFQPYPCPCGPAPDGSFRDGPPRADQLEQ